LGAPVILLNVLNGFKRITNAGFQVENPLLGHFLATFGVLNVLLTAIRREGVAGK